MSSNNTVCWVDIPVENLDRAMGFYSKVLGKEVTKQSAGPGCDFGLLPHFENNVAGCLAKMDDCKPSQNGSLVYFNVSGRLDAAIAAVKANGGKVLIEKQSIGPHGFRAVLLDTEGNRVALHSPTE